MAQLRCDSWGGVPLRPPKNSENLLQIAIPDCVARGGEAGLRGDACARAGKFYAGTAALPVAAKGESCGSARRRQSAGGRQKHRGSNARTFLSTFSSGLRKRANAANVLSLGQAWLRPADDECRLVCLREREQFAKHSDCRRYLGRGGSR
jgi:hypothetical protein